MWPALSIDRLLLVTVLIYTAAAVAADSHINGSLTHDRSNSSFELNAAAKNCSSNVAGSAVCLAGKSSRETKNWQYFTSECFQSLNISINVSTTGKWTHESCMLHTA